MNSRRNARLIIASVLAVIVATTGVVFAQDAAPPADNSTWYMTLYNLLGGVGISWIVAALKNVQFFKDHAKLVALIVSVLATLIPVLAHAPFAAKGAGFIVVSVVTQLVAAIGTHEVINKPTAAVVSTSDTSPNLPPSRF